MSLKDKQGIPRPIEDRSHILADHHKSVCEQPPTDPSPNTPICSDPAPVPLRPFTIEELRGAVARLRLGRSPGPDGVRTDWIKWTSHEFHLLLSNTFITASYPASPLKHGNTVV